jgi:hypothetical protein
VTVRVIFITLDGIRLILDRLTLSHVALLFVKIEIHDDRLMSCRIPGSIGRIIWEIISLGAPAVHAAAERREARREIPGEEGGGGGGSRAKGIGHGRNAGGAWVGGSTGVPRSCLLAPVGHPFLRGERPREAARSERERPCQALMGSRSDGRGKAA